MRSDTYDFVVLGAGSGGLTAARFAAELGARTALVERKRIGGDCTWTGCVPSKALLRAASVRHQVSQASRYGISADAGPVDMSRVREYVRSAIAAVYSQETPEELTMAGIEVVSGTARFANEQTVTAGGSTLEGRRFLITTGGRAARPPIPGLDQVTYLTYERLFDNDRLPRTLAIIGGGPIGLETAQAYARLGSKVVVFAEQVLPRDEPEARATLQACLEAEGIRFVLGTVSSVRSDGPQTMVEAAEGTVVADLLLVATGRQPNVEGLDLEAAGVSYSSAGIPVDNRLRTNVRHIYAAGDVVGGPQFTHLAAWQGFQASRNALLPGSSEGSAFVPWVTFTDPEVAHVGATEQEARDRFGAAIRVHTRPMSQVDRAVSDGATAGFVKIVTRTDNTLLGATVVASRAGELLGELTLALEKKLSLRDLAGIIHAYPTYSTSLQQVSAEATVAHLLGSTSGRMIRTLSRLLR